jgi:hypothetical protein
MAIQQKIAAALGAVADKQAEAERQAARERNGLLNAQRDGLREVLGALYDELGVGVDAVDGGWFVVDGVRFEVQYSEGREKTYSFAGREAAVWFFTGKDDNSPVRLYENEEQILAWIGEQIITEKASLEQEAEARATDERLSKLIASALVDATLRSWSWAEGYVLEYWLVTWHRGGGRFGSAWTFEVPADGDPLMTIDGAEILLSSAHLPVYERFEARSVDDLPAALKEPLMVTFDGMARVDGRLVEDEDGELEVPTNVWVPVWAVCEFIDGDDLAAGLDILASDDSSASDDEVGE